mmetsp:Transcript_23974/g.52482  ORF Transcript_23974/g.52482 Transcript_23974/m.52482 type:complete len:231 (-) Transcript_23974:394-1086(-)|eukprot:CAMPEP_0168190056 /NCGR_PEP_ID=MMETSP0139_2-20121125/16701_1 /TAXON_ID=44445 /ORGANISM="Pseudo-nitzschia australis, Strain 10249 10 AB" /LENGTH=230 /DNA_ID=CAMNT_0008112983 /DNA_START=160 /DNA_END=852 /DNA_ORIENTATION=-
MTAISEEQSHYRFEQAQLRRRFSIAKIRKANKSWMTSPAFIIGLSLALMAVVAFFAALIHMTSSVTKTVEAFRPVVNYRSHRSSNTRVFLEDWVADMIDGELYRQDHHKEYEEQWMAKNKGAVLSRMSDSDTTTSAYGYPSSMLGDREAFAEHKRDERMAFLKPQKYCADRCVATGNCDIFEDFYELGPEDVLKFCEECVLFDDDSATTESESGCDVPDAFYEKEPPLRP